MTLRRYYSVTAANRQREDQELIERFRELDYIERYEVLKEYDEAYDRLREKFNKLKHERQVLRDYVNGTNTRVR